MEVVPKRKSIRIKDYDYSLPGLRLFASRITIIRFQERILLRFVQQNVPLSPIGKTVEQAINQIPKHYMGISVDKFCIMPDHVHLILRITADSDGRMISAPTISTVIGSMKRWVSKCAGVPVWQKSFFDHGIRSQQDYDEIWTYIEYNPWKYLLKKGERQ